MTLSRFALAAALLAGLGSAAFPEEPAWTAGRSTVHIPMRDGRSLAADVMLPKERGRYPCVVIQTPYGKRHHGRDGGKSGGVYDRERYAYVVVDWRGFHGSRKARTHGRNDRGRDGYDVVEWAAARPWSDGRIGTWGPSALGKVQYWTAAERPPHLVCAVPLVASYGMRYEDYYEGGVLQEAHAQSLSRLGFGVSGPVRKARLPDATLYAITRRTEHYDRIEVPMLLVTGWYDHGTARQLETFDLLLAKSGERTRKGSRLLVGPWHHTALDLKEQGEIAYPDAAGEVERESRAFLDFHLRGKVDNGWRERARVRVWRCNEKGWRPSDAWPGDDTTQQVLHPRADGSLCATAAKEPEDARPFVDDPHKAVSTIGGANLPQRGLAAGPADQRRLLGRKDVLAYTTAPLEQPVRLAGRARLVVSLRADRPDTDVAVRLCEVDPDGRSMLVADSIQRASLTTGTQRLLTGDGAHEVAVTLPPLAFTFRKGHRIQVLVSGSNWPRFERNPHTGRLAWDADEAVAARVEVLHGGAAGSRLELPTRRVSDVRRAGEPSSFPPGKDTRER